MSKGLRLMTFKSTILKWYSRREEKGNDSKFENLWMRPYIIDSYRGNSALFLKNTDGTKIPGRPMNGRMLKHYVFQD